MEIRLDLQEIREHYDHTKLEKLEHDLTEEDHEWYNTHGWKHFRPENHIEYLLPSLGDPVCFHSSPEPVIEIKGRRFRMNVESDYNDEPWEAKGKTLVLTETTEPLSKGKPWKKKDWRAGHYYKVFGQPTWIQGECYPAHKGEPCYHLVTVECGWGDSGNWNILVGLDENGVPEAAYFEASCC
jgi:hypothetical protein